MKRKFRSMWRVAIALVLIAGLSLIVAAPVPAATPADTDVGFQFGANEATWSTAKAGDTGAMGGYSVFLNNTSGVGDNYVEFFPPSGITFANFQADITGAGDEWSFWNWAPLISGDPNAAQFELKFTDPADSTEFVDIMFVQHNLVGADVWAKVTVDKDVVSFQYWGPTISSSGAIVDFAALLALSANELDGGDYDLYQLTRVRVELYTETADSYIDDITINGTTYELEPIFLDAEYYSVGDTVVVTVPNFAANTDSVRINPVAIEISAPIADVDSWTVSVTSTSNTGSDIIVALQETGADTGVFTASFGTSTTLPVAEDEVYVEDGDTITVTYKTSSVDWGTGVASTTTITALVDDTVPTITVVSPADGDTTEDATPTIKASYSDAPAGIDQTSVEILVNGVDVTDDATVIGASVTYTPTDDLAEGSHDVVVNVEDNAGNAATESWSFRVVSWLVDTETVADGGSLDALDTVGVAVTITGDTGAITVGRYASNPEPDAPPTFSMIEDGFFDVQVLSAENATQIVIKFADSAITADSVAYFWDDIEGAWLECSDQGYNSVGEYLWVKVRTDTTPNIAELEGTPFALGGEPAVDILAYYRAYSGVAGVVETADLLKAANDWTNAVVPPGFTEAISTTQLLALANEWAATG